MTAARIDNSGLLARPRGFRVPSETLARLPPDRCMSWITMDATCQAARSMPGAMAGANAAAAATLARIYATGRPRRRPVGAPVAPPAIPVEMRLPRPTIGAVARRRVPDVVVPVHGGAACVLACLDSVLATLPQPSRVIVIDDASPEPELICALDTLARQKRIRLIRNPATWGFQRAPTRDSRGKRP